MNINIKQLETFVAVADMGSFRRAAKKLYTTQPNVSSRIAALESALSTKLMERDAGSVRLTARGHQLLDHARQVLRSMESFIEAVDEASLFDGVLRLGVTEMVAQTWLREFLQLFKQQFPNMQVELTVDLSINLEKELDNRSLDLTFQNGPFTRHSTASVNLGSFPIVWVAAPETGLHLLDPVSMQDITRFPILTHTRDTRSYQELSSHFASRSEMKVRLVPSNSLSVCRQMTIDFIGVSALLLPVVEADIATGQLCRINYDWAPSNLEFFARYDAYKSSHVVEFAANMAGEVSNQFAAKYIDELT
jgi:DNA-binding transcriptional LysR family regulator